MENFIQLKRKALETYFGRMNPEQKKAVFTVNGPVLILAGAGSGKTTVLVNRIANMVYFGNAYNSDYVPEGVTEDDLAFLRDFTRDGDKERLRDLVCDAKSRINPWNILAITFTNKAAGELKARLADMLGDAGVEITAATFHSACVRILRREIHQLGYNNEFVIYDSDDSQRLVKACLNELNISDKMFPPKTVASVISKAKDKFMSPSDLAATAGTNFRISEIARIYELYQQRLFSANALDFDDIICLTVQLFEKYPEVLRHYRNRYRYIMVDEYQDTNMVQYRLVSLLSAEHKNLCVVGDDDQSIYKFRGATIENILNFEDQFEDCTTIRLEQNYRSTQTILDAANSVIRNNRGRKTKSLWTAGDKGKNICLYKAPDDRAEGAYLSNAILDGVKNGGNYSDYAVLYRMNAQSNSVERAFTAAGIPYKVFGGMRFYDRKEVKDMLAYLSFINNPYDIVRMRRIINEPKRNIGEATVAAVEQISRDMGISPLEVMRNAGNYAPLSRKSTALETAAKMFDGLCEKSKTMSLDELLDELVDDTGYRQYMDTLGEEGITRMENIAELKTTMRQYSETAEEPSLSGFLEEISLYTDTDKYEEQTNVVSLMTIHTAKGLEFPIVFVVGMEDGIFPSARCMDSEDDLEEERRLAYVAITRAKKELYLTHCAQRMFYGRINSNMVSRFAKEITTELVDKVDGTIKLTKNTGTSSPMGFSAKSSGSVSLESQIATQKKASAVSNVVFAVGDRIKHKVFGEGTVISAKKMSNDTMLEVSFDDVGTKKLMANFAKLEKV